MGYRQRREDGPPLLTMLGVVLFIMLLVGVGGSLDDVDRFTEKPVMNVGVIIHPPYIISGNAPEWIRRAKGVAYLTDYPVNVFLQCGGSIVEQSTDTCVLQFPGVGPPAYVRYSSQDYCEAILDLCDQAEIQAWLRLSPGNADIPTVISLMYNQYSHHTSLVGISVITEPDYMGSRTPPFNIQPWLTRAKSHGIKLAVHDFQPDGSNWSPHITDADLIYIYNGQSFSGLDTGGWSLRQNWATFASTFPTHRGVVFGYVSDQNIYDQMGGLAKVVQEAAQTFQGDGYVACIIGGIFQYWQTAEPLPTTAPWLPDLDPGTLTVYTTLQDNTIVLATVTITDSSSNLTYYGVSNQSIPVDPDTYAIHVEFTDANGTLHTRDRSTIVTSGATVVETFTFPVSQPPTTDDTYTVTILGSSGGATVPAAGAYTYLISQLFSVSAYALAGYAFTQWLLGGDNAGTTPTLSFPGYTGGVYTVQPVFTIDVGADADTVPEWRRPNPYIPEVWTSLPDPVSGPRIPYALPAPTLPTADSTLFTHILTLLTQSTPDDIAMLLQQLQRYTPPRLAEVLQRLTHAKVTL